MAHLVLHLATQARITGPVLFRWMYFIERYLGLVKSHVCNKSHPEASIAKAVRALECVNFCSWYLEGFDHIFNLVSRDMNDASMVDTSNNIEYDFSVFSQVGKPLGKPITHTIIQMDKLQAQRYVLFNCPDVTEFLQVQGAELKRRSRPRRLTLNAIERLQHDIS